MLRLPPLIFARIRAELGDYVVERVRALALPILWVMSRMHVLHARPLSKLPEVSAPPETCCSRS